MMVISARTSLILIALIIIILVTKSEAEARSQVIKITCDRQSVNNQTLFVQNFVDMMENVGAQMVSSRDGTALVGTGADSAFALAQCYGDLSSDDCIRCFAEVRRSTILPRCFPYNGGRIYLDGCYMRFQNYSFFDEYTGPDDTIVCGNTSKQSRPFEETARQAVSNAVADSLRNMYSSRDYNKGYFAREDILVPGNGNTSVYVMAECWKTLIPDLCRVCLMNASASVTNCLPWSEGRALNTGCFMRYSDTNFLNPLTADSNRNSLKKKKKSHLSVILPIVFTLVVFSFTLIVYAWRKKNRSHHNAAQVNKDQKQDSDLPFFSLNEVVKATRNFSTDNKLGQGGFGAVYKGVLEEGGEIAVKRLSKTSRQGLPEFQNEVSCIAKLQHRNLVKLLGCCVQGEEMMLIYEYMPNKSLDSFLFDKNNCVLLDWPQRYHIINGIARGLLYLHQDSRLRIIHRDLKASNILLDSNMNPKISDFGLARMFKEYETEANTNKVVGTLGYISPEYAANGLFSVKSDVFSFGVLVLEIVSGKKNRGFSHQSHHDNLLGHAWRLYKEAKPLELVDAALGDSRNVSEVLQSIHVGLSCVQQQADDRPYMSSVVHMLGGEGALPMPKQPGFFTDSTLTPPHVSVSINEATLSQLDAR